VEVGDPLVEVGRHGSVLGGDSLGYGSPLIFGL
jgi:hypothetical protein